MNKNLLVIDTETGGLSPETSLLSIGLLLANSETFEIIEEVELLLKPDDDNYVVCAEAMKINKINLVEHNNKAIPYREAKTKLYKHLSWWSGDGKFKLDPLGKQVAGDISRIWQNVLQRNTWEQFVSYQQIDVSSICKFMQACGLLPKEIPGSLASLCEYFKIQTEGQHNALVDCRLTLEVYKKLFDKAYPYPNLKAINESHRL